MDDEAAEAERRRVEEEHAEAGGQNRWIRLGNVSFQSKELRTIEVSEPPQADAHFGDDATPLFRRDMEL